jgi:hypothetical protein
MALAILDGTQTATTLSTILSSGQHITAHTVVSLGTQAKTDILSAVSSGISISGTVTANLNKQAFLIDDFYYWGVPIGYQVGEDSHGVVNIYNSSINSGPLPIQCGFDSVSEEIIPLSVVGTVTIGAGTAQIGSVTVGNSVTVGAIIGPSGGNCLKGISGSGDAVRSLLFVKDNSGSYGETSGSGIGVFNIPVYGSVTIGAGTAQIGSVTASLAISSTAITSGVFSSLTSATLVPANTARKMATVYNLGAGQLFVNAGATATTLGGGFMVALSSGDFYECDYTTTTLSAIFATAGTASWVSH